MLKKIALITGITGQDGSYLTEFLLNKNYEVHGIIRRSSVNNTKNIGHLIDNPNLKLHYGDLNDSSSLFKILSDVKPNEIYNLGAMSHVQVSFQTPEYTAKTDGIGVLKLLECIRILKMEDTVRFYQAGTSEMFGKVQEIPQKETTPFYPRSPYGVAKLYAHWIVKNYRESYNLFACNGILFNHESPRRGEDFVTRKITKAVTRIKLGLQDKLELGNLDSERDWGFSGDYVEAMWLMLQQKTPQDYVISSGKTTSIREFVELAFKEIGITLSWSGLGKNEVGICNKTNKIYVAVNPEFYRPTEVDMLIGDSSNAHKDLGWFPKTSLIDLIKMMINSDLLLAESEKLK